MLLQPAASSLSLLFLHFPLIWLRFFRVFPPTKFPALLALIRARPNIFAKAQNFEGYFNDPLFFRK